ncbi:MAG TPA: acireductone synthase [Kofleriaceae bacterium]|nr:acireductone synthase [Kofleriaceae bacterium]
MLRPILTDLEGTTSSIAFVKEVLFPYARAHLREFLASHPAVRAELARHYQVDDVTAAVDAAMAADSKETRLKQLQGLIWADGYQRGELAAHFYGDAVAALRAWHAAGHSLHVYSSGSVQAQHLFFRHSVAGDLEPLITGWFDTEIGGKRDPDSYRRIAAVVGAAPLFLSDVVAELDAARAAGCDTVLVDRRQDYPEPRTCDHPRVESFAAIDP